MVPREASAPRMPALRSDWLLPLVTGIRPRKADAIEMLDGVDEDNARVRAIAWLLNHAELSIEGDGGDDTAYRVAARVMDFGLSPDDALGLMLEHWNDRCEPPWETEQLETIVNNAAQYRQKPIGAESADVEFEDVSAEVAQAETGANSGHEWRQPQNLWEDASKSGAPPDMHDDLYPPSVQGWVDDEAERKGVFRGAVSTMALVMFAGSISARYQVQVRQKDTGFKNRPTVWAMAVGGPGSGKSPSQSAAMEPLKKVERERLRRFRDEMRIYSAAQKAEKGKASSVSVDDPAKPRNRCRVLQDATAEAVVGREAQSGHGVTIALDELDSFFGSFDAYRSGKSSKDAPFYLAGKNGEPWEVSRVSRDAVSTDLHAVNILGGIQPSVAHKVAGAMGGNGMLQRFLICHMGKSRRAPDRAPDERLAAVVDKAVRTLSELEPDSTSAFKMHPDADLYRGRIVDFVEEHIAQGDLPIGLRGWLDKMEGEWARIALILHLVEWAASSEALFDDAPHVISPETAQRAERFLLGYQWEQQRFFYERVIGDSAAPSDAARKIADHILAHERREIANRDIIQGVRSIEDRFERAAAMVVLERAGWVRPIPPLKGGGAIRWTINPAVHELFSARAVEEAQRKFAARSAIIETGAERRAAAMTGA